MSQHKSAPEFLKITVSRIAAQTYDAMMNAAILSEYTKCVPSVTNKFDKVGRGLAFCVTAYLRDNF